MLTSCYMYLILSDCGGTEASKSPTFFHQAKACIEGPPGQSIVYGLVTG